MNSIKVDLSRSTGTVKPMHAVNNGPVCKLDPTTWGANGNMNEFKAAGIPYARTHDASFYDGYGGQYTVDVHAIFTNFDADPEDPASYDFLCTDDYLLKIEAAGCKTFYRLGSKIEHTLRKYGTLVPKDYKKWAVICEHIIRHYTEGWADGYHMDIEYWEIWNEPDLDADDSANKRCWGGTKAEFFDFYHVAATHLKSKFPHLKIGGPAIAGKLDWAEDFLAQLKAPLDFFSWHIYAHSVDKVADKSMRVRALLDKYGFNNTESILNEWNYVLGWHGDEISYSHITQRLIKGASFTLGTMCACQNAGCTDMLMYYDARPTSWNGLFDFQQIGRNTCKGYYPFVMFNELYKLGELAEITCEGEGVYGCAARKDGEAAVIMTCFDDALDAPCKEVSLDLCGLGGENGAVIEIYALDETRDLTLCDTFTCYGSRLVWKKEIPNHTCYLLKVKAL